MNITPIYYNNYISHDYSHSVNNSPNVYFSGLGTSCGLGVSISKNVSSERNLRNIEYFFRVIGNKLRSMFEGRTTHRITQNIANIKPESNAAYLEALNETSRYYSTSKDIEVNLDDRILEKIAASGKSTIFIMNHSNQTQDPSMLAVLNALLTRAYAEFDKFQDFPLPKIILNKDILTSMSDLQRKAYEAFGAVGVDASLSDRNAGFNARVFLPLIKDFVRDKCNIFIFPEGRLAIRKSLPLEGRFQPGIAELINKILGIKKEVTVVPVGFAYGRGKTKDLTAMEIGVPVVFTREGNVTKVTSGSIPGSEFAKEGFAKFFEKHKDKINVPITKQGQPVGPAQIVNYIKSMLCENLNICTLKAKQKINDV